MVDSFPTHHMCFMNFSQHASCVQIDNLVGVRRADGDVQFRVAVVDRAGERVDTIGMSQSDAPNRIVRAAKALFTEKGYGATSIADGAAVCGVRNGALYYHFASKQDVLLTS